MEIFFIFLLIVIAAIAVGAIQLSMAKDLFCTACGHVGPGKTHTRGSIGMEILLWLLLIVPGLIYSVWRHTTRGEVCGVCGAANLIPLDSPVAQKMRRDLAAK
jgi:hypothetical protein